MDPLTISAFADEMSKIACGDTPAARANALFGLPVGPPHKRNVRFYDQGSAAAKSPDGSQYPIDAQSTANLSQGGAQYPATGPGGV
jgi:hypothetical protein